MPALLERPKLSNAMARALHRHIMMERERKRQGEPGSKREDTRFGRSAVHGDPHPRADQCTTAEARGTASPVVMVVGVKKGHARSWEGPWRAPNKPPRSSPLTVMKPIPEHWDNQFLLFFSS